MKFVPVTKPSVVVVEIGDTEAGLVLDDVGVLGVHRQAPHTALLP